MSIKSLEVEGGEKKPCLESFWAWGIIVSIKKGNLEPYSGFHFKFYSAVAGSINIAGRILTATLSGMSLGDFPMVDFATSLC
jgi:hypothetical protein